MMQEPPPWKWLLPIPANHHRMYQQYVIKRLVLGPSLPFYDPSVAAPDL